VIGPSQYVMRFPNVREVEKALYVERMTLKLCDAIVRLSPWSDVVGSDFWKLLQLK
jgi:hypothetical protein